MINKNKKKILLWSPMLSYVGTINAVLKTAECLSNDNIVYVLNIFNQNDLKVKNKNIYKKHFFYFKNIPRTGLASKVFIYFFSFISLPLLIRFVYVNKINLIITHLVGVVPLLLKFFIKDLKIFCSIQGFPKMNIFRKILWKIFYNKSDLIITMSDYCKIMLEEIIKEKSKITVINNPIITYEIIRNSKEKIEDEYVKIFQNRNIIMIGRLTKQKNHIEMLKAFKNIQKNFSDVNFVILGEGELHSYLTNFIFENNIKNVYLLGYKSNPYKYLSKSNLFLSSSLWEDPGHSLIEAAFLEIPIVTSNCPAAPKEIFHNNNNCLQYSTGNINDLEKKVSFFFENENCEVIVDNKKKLNFYHLNLQKKNSIKKLSNMFKLF